MKENTLLLIIFILFISACGESKSKTIESITDTIKFPYTVEIDSEWKVIENHDEMFGAKLKDYSLILNYSQYGLFGHTTLQSLFDNIIPEDETAFIIDDIKEIGDYESLVIESKSYADMNMEYACIGYIQVSEEEIVTLMVGGPYLEREEIEKIFRQKITKFKKATN